MTPHELYLALCEDRGFPLGPLKKPMNYERELEKRIRRAFIELPNSRPNRQGRIILDDSPKEKKEDESLGPLPPSSD